MGGNCADNRKSKQGSWFYGFHGWFWVGESCALAVDVARDCLLVLSSLSEAVTPSLAALATSFLTARFLMCSLFSRTQQVVVDIELNRPSFPVVLRSAPQDVPRPSPQPIRGRWDCCFEQSCLPCRRETAPCLLS